MCDGTKSSKGLTQSLKEVVLIISVLIHKFDFQCNIYMQRNQPTIYVNTASMKKLTPKIAPYFIPSMLYKLQFIVETKEIKK